MINTANMPRAYTEVYEFMNMLGEDYIKQVPSKVYNVIRDNRDVNFSVKYDLDQRFDKDTFSLEALTVISALNLQYWCKDEEVKEELKKAYLENTQKEKEKYSYENLFKNKSTVITSSNSNNKENSSSAIATENTEQTTLNSQEIAKEEYPMVVKENFITKIINKIKEFFQGLKK